MIDSVGDSTKFDASNNYHEKLRTEYLDKIQKHYHVLPHSDTLSMHSNGFSDDKLTILVKLFCLQKNRSNFKVLKDFLSQKNITVFRNDSIFPDFEINLVNQTIKCISKQLLEDLERIVKQLVRYLGPDFKDAMKNQFEAFDRSVDSYYRDDRQIYLNARPKSLLNLQSHY